MAKAKITTRSGLVVQIDGSPAEIAAVLDDVKKKEEAPQAAKGRKKGKVERATLPDLIWSLIDGGFFKKKPQDLAAVKRALAEMGHHYPLTSLSGAMLRQVRQRNLRRMRDKKRWVYTG